MKNVLILEDAEIESKVLRSIVGELEEECQVFECNTCERAYYLAMEQTMHIFLVDVRLENDFDFSGFKFVQNLRQVDKYKEVPVIFISSVQGYELMAFRKMHCYDFITKPFSKEEVKSVVDKALKLRAMERVNERIDFEVNGIYYPVDASDIRYIEANRRVLYIYTIADVLELPGKSLKECSKLLNDKTFRQVHKSYIISRKYIYKADLPRKVIYISTGETTVEIPIGLKYREGLWEWLNGN